MTGYSFGAKGGGWLGSDGGMVGVSSGDIVGDVGFGAGLNVTKNTALVRAPETFWRWMDVGRNCADVHDGTFCGRRVN